MYLLVCITRFCGYGVLYADIKRHELIMGGSLSFNKNSLKLAFLCGVGLVFLKIQGYIGRKWLKNPPERERGFSWEGSLRIHPHDWLVKPIHGHFFKNCLNCGEVHQDFWQCRCKNLIRYGIDNIGKSCGSALNHHFMMYCYC